MGQLPLAVQRLTLFDREAGFRNGAFHLHGNSQVLLKMHWTFPCNHEKIAGISQDLLIWHVIDNRT